ncbi:MAG: hypothetical protein EXQ79_08865 [Acidimicrobiia bacterium]|nr:hypothetical protein [Acidimicrobiia bacterium]
MSLMMALAALVIDLGNARQQDRQAEAAADAAALAGAQRLEDFGSTFTGSTSQWAEINAAVKSFATVNFGVAASSWIGCSDSKALTYHPDAGNSNSCISADLAYWPPALPNEASLTNRIRVQLPEHLVETGFGKAIDQDSLSVSAAAVSAVTRATTSATTTVIEEEAGGPCALCVLGPELSLDGQNGDITVRGGNVVVNSTATTGASLHSNGHVKVLGGGTIGGPSAPGNFSGSGFSPAPTNLAPVSDPLAAVPACGTGSTCPTNSGGSSSTLNPGIYTNISGSHTLNPGIYIVKNMITLNGNDLLVGSGVMLYLACSSYPNPCTTGQAGAWIKATGNGAMRLKPPTAAQCASNSAICPYVGLSIFADRNNTATSTYRGNGTNENGLNNGGAGTFYLKSGTLDLRGNGYTLSSQIVVNFLTMEGNPSGVSVVYDLSQNVPLTHSVEYTTSSSAQSFDSGGLVG